MVTDETIEQVLRAWWDIDRLEEIEDEITVDEWVNRVFKDRTTMVRLSGKTLYFRVFGISWEQLSALVDLCRGLGLKLSFTGSKEYTMFIMEIC